MGKTTTKTGGGGDGGGRPPPKEKPKGGKRCSMCNKAKARLYGGVCKSCLYG